MEEMATPLSPFSYRSPAGEVATSDEASLPQHGDAASPLLPGLAHSQAIEVRPELAAGLACHQLQGAAMTEVPTVSTIRL